MEDNKIISIRERLPQPVKMEDGVYQGILSGHCITIIHKKRVFELEIKDGIRGTAPVIVIIKDGVGIYEFINN